MLETTLAKTPLQSALGDIERLEQLIRQARASLEEKYSDPWYIEIAA